MTSEDKLRRLILEAFPDRVAKRREGRTNRALMTGGRGIVLDEASVVRDAGWFVALDPRDPPAGGGSEARVRLASAIDPAWLKQCFPHLVREEIEHQFDAEKERVVSRRVVRFQDLAISESPVSPKDDLNGASRTLAEAIAARADAFLARDESAAALLARVRFLCRHAPDLDLPAFDGGSLAGLLTNAVAGCTSLAEIASRGGWSGVLDSALGWSARKLVDDHAPATIEVPSGSRIRLKYDPLGEATPVLAVRVQELFGMPESPRVACGRVAVTLHLLGPNFRPVQVTSDLKSFWNSTYADVRKELRARYPKHPWPEDPWNAPPRAVGRRRSPG